MKEIMWFACRKYKFDRKMFITDTELHIKIVLLCLKIFQLKGHCFSQSAALGVSLLPLGLGRLLPSTEALLLLIVYSGIVFHLKSDVQRRSYI